MALKTETVKVNSDKFEIFVTDDTIKNSRRKVYSFDTKKAIIKFFPGKDKSGNNTFYLAEIVIEGFKYLPPEFAKTGYIKGGALYYINKKFRDKKAKKVTISKTRMSEFKVSEAVLNYADFERLKNSLSRIIQESKTEKSKFVDDFFYDTYPKAFSEQTDSSKTRYNKVISNLDKDVIKHFDGSAIKKFETFYQQLVSTKYNTGSKKINLVSQTKIKIDQLAVDTVISEFEKLLKQNTSEASWGKFLLKNLFLIDSKYVKAIPQMNVVLAGARVVDFGLVDYQGNLDIFEIKKPSTNLLSATQDRGNFFFHPDLTKAITQAEKYLYQAEGKRDSLEKDILSEKEISVKIIKPRAILLIGKSAQLNTEKKKIDFRILRNSLKNVEIVLFDELLDRIKNLKGKIYK